MKYCSFFIALCLLLVVTACDGGRFSPERRKPEDSPLHEEFSEETVPADPKIPEPPAIPSTGEQSHTQPNMPAMEITEPPAPEGEPGEASDLFTEGTELEFPVPSASVAETETVDAGPTRSDQPTPQPSPSAASRKTSSSTTTPTTTHTTSPPTTTPTTTEKTTKTTHSTTPIDHPYVASQNSKVFHLKTCGHVNQIKEHNRVYFQTREEAVQSGREPCQHCKP
ncbi:MAG TPA: Ada metal-binding domain-containing protein [Bacillota bacterium]|jgi:hypothetical protein|nr:hypothetical protein [Fastidiosipila sp.]HPX92659.1 Ada metal-binding domain-containing protein [Bacillota bacterium]HQB81026.1 Ada metal-binding domain-containing protein [Bacillota bacterium]